jgi:hypothetical protein
VSAKSLKAIVTMGAVGIPIFSICMQ